ncbi:MAG: hypothetical protein PHC93_05065 [Candidatus Omnitrophica bacterium]|nr:hypothetical protein [Candidatus Omnitrophota bacterium]
MERSFVELNCKDFTQLVFVESTSKYVKVEEEINYVELGMGIKSSILIAKRKVDNKFFKFIHISDEGRNSLEALGLANHFPIRGEEVFPTQITKTIYK